MAGLTGYVDEYGNITSEGISKAVSVLNGMKRILSNIVVKEVYVFATASLRNIGNTEEARDKINEQTGFDLQVISGEQETVYGYIGATHHLQTTEGILADIGGGSTELVFYKDGRVEKACSVPIGSLNMYSKHVKKLIPTKSELQTITEIVEAGPDEIDKPESQSRLICGVGGTIRAACKLNNEVFEMPSSNRTLDIERLEEIIKTVRGNDKGSFGHILKVVPERIHTIIPGMTILKTAISAAKPLLSASMASGKAF